MNLQGASKEPQMMRQYKYFLILTQRYVSCFETEREREGHQSVASCTRLYQGWATFWCTGQLSNQLSHPVWVRQYKHLIYFFRFRNID